jgi:hypothetical protein
MKIEPFCLRELGWFRIFQYQYHCFKRLNNKKQNETRSKT